MNDKSQLRGRAEDRLKVTRAQVRAMSVTDVQELVHELQVHQVELQMQNEELRRAQEELQLSRQKYSDLYDFAPVGYLTLTKEGIIADVNFMASLWLGLARGELKGRKFYDFVKPRYQDAYFMHYRRVFDTGGRQTCELEIAPRDLFVQLNSQVHIPEDGYCCTTLTDVTHLIEATRPPSRAESRMPGPESFPPGAVPPQDDNVLHGAPLR